jgi:hypothetical protein
MRTVDTQKLEQGVLGTPKIWDRVSPGNLARVSNLWPVHMSSQNLRKVAKASI